MDYNFQEEFEKLKGEFDTMLIRAGQCELEIGKCIKAMMDDIPDERQKIMASFLVMEIMMDKYRSMCEKMPGDAVFAGMAVKYMKSVAKDKK